MFFSIKRVRLSNFRSFLGEHDSGPLPTSGLILINGINKDTGGSSGSGKSNFTLAIAYALGYSHIPATKLQCRKTEDPMQVEVLLETSIGEVVVRRGSETSIQGPDFVLKGATAVNAKIQELLGFDTSMLKSLTYRPQRKFDFFLSLDDAEKRRFLTTLLNLEKLEAVGLKYKTQALELETAKKKCEDRVIGLSQNISLRKQRELTLTPDAIKETAFLQQRLLSVEEYTKKLNELADEWSFFEKENKAQSSFLKKVCLEFSSSLEKDVEKKALEWMALNNSETKTLSDEIDGLSKREKVIRDRILAVQVELKSAEKKLLQRHQEVSFSVKRVSQLKAAIAEKQKKADETLEQSLRYTGTCPLCEQDTKDQKVVDTYKANADKLYKEVDALSAQLEATAPLAVGLSEIDTELALLPQDPRLKELEEELRVSICLKKEELSKELTKRIKTNDENYKTYLKGLKKDKEERQEIFTNYMAPYIKRATDADTAISNLMRITQKELLDAKNQKALILQKLAFLSSVEQKAKDNSREIKELEGELEGFVLKLKDIEQAIALANEVSLIFSRDGFYGLIFEEVVDSMVTYINRNSKFFPNIADLTFGFDMQKATQKGDIKNRITPYIFEGDKLPLAESISGGQLTSFELLTDFAFYDTVFSRTKKMPSYLILDESFNGHDNRVKESCLEFLKRNSVDRAIFIVDHATEFKEMFDRHLNIVCENGMSRIEER